MTLFFIMLTAIFTGLAIGQIVIDQSESVEEDGRVRVHPREPDTSGFYGRFPMDAVPEGYTLIREKRSLDSSNQAGSKVDDRVIIKKTE